MPSTSWSRPYLRASSVPNDQPRSQGRGRPRSRTKSIAAAHVEGLRAAAVERALARSARRRRAAGVEPQHGEVGQGGQPSGGLAEDVRVHEPAGGGQRMQRHERRDRLAIRRQRELADEGQPVERLELDVLPARRQQSGPRISTSVRSAHQLILQQWVCQCLRAARSACSPSTPSARQATRCATPGSIVRPQPGQMYGFCPPRCADRLHDPLDAAAHLAALPSREQALERVVAVALGPPSARPRHGLSTSRCCCECAHAPHGVP